MDETFFKGLSGHTETAADKADVSSLRILIVEDDADSREMLCELLSLLGHQVQSAAHAEEADAKLEQGWAQVLLTDISLPGMSGVELARKSLARDANLTAVFVSGYGSVPDADFPYQSLRKPYDLMQLQALLAKAAAKLQGA